MIPILNKENVNSKFDEFVVLPPLLRSVNGAFNTTSTEILVLTSTLAKECYPRIHRLSLFSLSFSLSFSLPLSLIPISGDSSSCRKRPKSRRRGSQLLKRLQILNTRVDRRTFSSQHVSLYTKNKIPLLKLIFVLLIYYLKYHNSSTYITSLL